MTGTDSFHHEAFFYSDRDQYLAAALPFIKEGLEAGESVLAAVDSDKIALLSSELGSTFDRLRFLDMPSMGQNPARIIPVWQEFVNEHVAEGQPARGIGEPVWPERTDDELVECDHHESLLNLAFADAPPWRLLCPYDSSRLDDATLEQARRNHPWLSENGSRHSSQSYLAPGRNGAPFAGKLSEPSVPVDELDFGLDTLAGARRFAMQSALDEGFDMERTTDLTLAVSEVAANSILYAGGMGRLRIWREPGSLVCEVRDSGRIEDPLVGRRRPRDATDSKGLWIVNNLCDLVQIRSGEDGSIVRLHMRVDPAA